MDFLVILVYFVRINHHLLSEATSSAKLGILGVVSSCTGYILLLVVVRFPCQSESAYIIAGYDTIYMSHLR